MTSRNGFILGAASALLTGGLVMFIMHNESSAGATPQTAAPEPARAEASTPASLPAAMPAEPDVIPQHAPKAAMPLPAGEALISGTIALDDSLANSVQGTVTVFVIARDSSAGKGHPVFAKRLDVASFPAAFTLSAGDSMMSGSTPKSVSLEARIDLDGDAITKEANAPAAKLDGVSLGTRDVALKLKL